MSMGAEAIPQAREYRLFGANTVGIVAFLCGPLAGAILIAINYFRLEKAGKGVLAVILGMIATALTILVKLNVDPPFGSLAFLAISSLFVFCTWKIAKQEQGNAIEEHIAQGGQLASQAAGFGVGIATAAITFVVASAALYSYQYRKILVIGARDQVIYSGLATKGDATALGNALKSSHYFQELGTSVLLNKGIGSKAVSFVVQDDAWNQTGVLSSFEELAREVAPAVGGLPIQVQIVDTRLDVKDQSTVGVVSFGGNNAVYYEGSATKAEAQTLGRKLESMGFFRVLVRHYGGTTIAFVVVGEAWKNPSKLSSLEAIVREVAPTIGGLPIDMQLVNAQLQVQKDEQIEENQEEGQ